jgi:hypothetical protein
MGCVADVEEGVAPEDVAEVVQPVTRETCLKSCKVGGEYFRRLFCPKVGAIEVLSCTLAVDLAVKVCHGPCQEGMDKKTCEDRCCDELANSLEDYCSGVPKPLRRQCEMVAIDAGGLCNKSCK